MGLSSPGEFYDLSLTDQAEGIRHWQISEQECRHCGRARSECSDPNVQWYAHRSICFATQARVHAERTVGSLHEKAPHHDGTYQSWNEKQSAKHPLHHSDGVTVWVDVVDHDPDDDFMSNPEAQPAQLRAAQQSERGDAEAGDDAERSGGA